MENRSSEETDTIIDNDGIKFNSGIATAMAIRELLNQATIARMKGVYITSGDRIGYFDFIDSIYIELWPFMDNQIKEQQVYSLFYEIKVKFELKSNISFEEQQKVREFELRLRQIAKNLGFLMPKKRDPRFGGY